MDIAIVTGASSSLGLAISRRLIQLGFRVYGLGGDYADCPLNNVNFKPLPCDLADPDAVEQACLRILEKEGGVYVLVNNAKYFGKSLFPEMDNREMERILRINLLCPLVLSRTLAGSLMNLQGYIIQLGSTYAETSRGGPVGAAASGGLKWMGEVLFHDLRDHGVKVCQISPEPNRGRDPRGVARPGARTEASIDPDAVAQAIEQILQSSFGNIVTEMIMRPLRVKEPDFDPVIRLPYPVPKPVPYTVPRELIEAEEKLEDEEIDQQERQNRERRRGRKRDEPVPSKATPEEKETVSEAKEAAAPSRQERPARQHPPRRSETPDREARGDKRDSRHRAPARRDEAPARPAEAEKPQPEKADTVEAARSTPQPMADRDPERTGSSRRRRSRRKPRPPLTSVGFLDRQRSTEAPAPADERPSPFRETSPSTQPRQDRPQAAAEPAKEVTPAAKAPAASRPAEAVEPASGQEAASPDKAAKKAARKGVKKAARKTSPARKAVPAKAPAGESESESKAAAKKVPARKVAAKKRPARKRAAKKAAPDKGGESS